MTDEQVQQIVDALKGDPWEPWTQVGIALLSVVVGYLLAWGNEARGRRRTRREDAAKRKAAAARRASLLYLRLVSAPEALREEQLRDVHRETPEIASDLNEFDRTGTVAGWWMRQVTRAIESPPVRGDDGRVSFDAHAGRAMSAQVRLQAWAEGEVPVTDFEPAHDQEWEQAMLAHYRSEIGRSDTGGDRAS
ncbi:hypothetical protein [uncultured Microbacterium sp.]|uniref:hypothetical protein n=1 Tax=uncultured Microbacterium sp. TaxID=191216 RepID=UPI0025CE927C|nr:hypothetical protein [uncultured Microbacterium sp.]